MRNSRDRIDGWKPPLRGVVYIVRAQSCRMGMPDTNARCDPSVSRISPEQPRSPSLRIAGAAVGWTTCAGRLTVRSHPAYHRVRLARVGGADEGGGWEKLLGGMVISCGRDGMSFAEFVT